MRGVRADGAGGMNADRPVTLAAIIGAHGIAGEVRLKVFADDLASYKSFNNGALTLKSVRSGSNVGLRVLMLRTPAVVFLPNSVP